MVLDVGLPGRSGLGVLRNWRAAGVGTPVLILTARDAGSERVEGLRAGTDDYVGKPFHSEELTARLQALLRRSTGRAVADLVVGDLRLDEETPRAPAISDYAAWQPRLSKDRQDLYRGVIRGIGEQGAWNMPPRGGNDALTDADVRRAVDFMLAAVEALRTE